MTPTLEQREVAFHEAGHCVVAMYLGCRVRAATIRPDDDCRGLVSFVQRSVPPLSVRQDIAISCGGPLAQWKFSGMRDDRGAFADDLALASAYSWQDFQAGALLALDILQKRWAAVRRIARLLLASGTIDGRVVHAEYQKRRRRRKGAKC